MVIIMKIIYSCFFCIVLLALTVFTIFGEHLYALGKPIVTTTRASSFIGENNVIFSIDALHYDETGHYVYILLSERGYSRVIYTVSRVNVEVISIETDLVRVLHTDSGIEAGDRLVVAFVGTIINGNRVNLHDTTGSMLFQQPN
jgi:hypothetical protein